MVYKCAMVSGLSPWCTVLPYLNAVPHIFFSPFTFLPSSLLSGLYSISPVPYRTVHVMDLVRKPMMHHTAIPKTGRPDDPYFCPSNYAQHLCRWPQRWTPWHKPSYKKTKWMFNTHHDLSHSLYILNHDLKFSWLPARQSLIHNSRKYLRLVQYLYFIPFHILLVNASIINLKVYSYRVISV